MDFDSNDLWQFDDMPQIHINSRGRASNAANEDDYDYALELRPDDEYRQAAEALSDVTEDIETALENSLDDLFDAEQERLEAERKSRPTSMSSIDSDDPLLAAMASGVQSRRSSLGGRRNSLQSVTSRASRGSRRASADRDFFDIDVIEEEKEEEEEEEEEVDSAELQARLQREEHQKQVKETRDKLEWDRFLITMAKGVHVRRHEAHHLAETVRLYSNNGGHTIKWAPKVAHDLAKQRQTQRVNEEGTTKAIYAGVNDSNGFDCCFAVCGCGDDLLTGNNYKASSMTSSHRNLNQTPARRRLGSDNSTGAAATAAGGPATARASAGSGNIALTAAAAPVVGAGAGSAAPPLVDEALGELGTASEEEHYVGGNSCFFNCGYHHRGNVVDMDVVAIHPATAEDPTKPGYYGTECLRASRDVFNPSYTFSVVYQRPVPSGLLDRIFKSNAGDAKSNHRVDDHVSSSEDPVRSAAAAARAGQEEEAVQVNFNSVVTLDIECETEDAYKLLFQGFHSLHRRCVRKKYEQMIQQHNSANPENVLNYNYDDIESHRARGFHVRNPRNHDISLWAKSDADNSLLQPSSNLPFGSPLMQRRRDIEVEQPKEKGKNPIKKLFKGTLSLDPLRAMGVGGGLLPVRRPNQPSTSLKQSQKPLPQAAFLGWRSEGTQIWGRLRLAGLETKVVYSWDLRRIILKVKCPPARLEEVAEKMHLRIRRKDGTLKVFKRSKRESFQACVTTCGGLLSPLGHDGNGHHDETPLFRSSERQQIIDYIIRSKIKDGGAELDEDTHLGSFIVQRFPLHMYARLEEIRHTWVTFWKSGAATDVAQPWLFFSTEYVPVDPADIPVTSLGSVDNKIVENQYHYRPLPKVSMKDVFSQVATATEHFFANVLVQPLDNIAEYYGEGVAFYFAFLAFYTRWLIIPSVVGFIVFCVQLSTHSLDNVYCVPYAVMIMLWSSFMLVFWRQKSSALAYRWGVLEYEVEETERPQFRGEYMYDDSTGEVHKVYPAWRRVLKYMISFPLLLCIMGVMLLVMVTVFSSQNKMLDAYINQQPLDMTPADGVSSTLGGGGVGGGTTDASAGALGLNTTAVEPPNLFTLSVLDDSDFWTVAIFYPCIYVILVEGFAAIVEKLAIMLNNFENHRTQTAFMNRLILKVFSFRFVAVNMPLVYDMLTTKNPEEAYVRMSLMIFCQLTAGFYWAVFLDVCVPSLYQRLMLYHMKMNVAKANRRIYAAKEHSDMLRMEAEGDAEMGMAGGGGLADRKSNISSKSGSSSSSYGRRASFGASVISRRAQYLEQARSKCWEEALQPIYESFSDYTALVVQLGFVLLYAPIFPLAPLIALLNNIALIRLNAFKLTYTRQRPVAQKVSGIGVWEDVLQLISVAGVLANCALFGFISNILMDLFETSGGGAAVALLLFLFEHGILFFKYWLQTSVPMVPMAVQRAQQRERRSTMDLKRKKTEERRKSHASQSQRQSGVSFMSPENIACNVPFANGGDDDFEDGELLYGEDEGIDRLSYRGVQEYASTDSGGSASEEEVEEARAPHPEQNDDEYYASHLESNLVAARRNSHAQGPRAPPTTPHVWSFMQNLDADDASPLDHLGYGQDHAHAHGLGFGQPHVHHSPYQSLQSLHYSGYSPQHHLGGQAGGGSVVHHVIHHHHRPPEASPSEYNETPTQSPVRAESPKPHSGHRPHHHQHSPSPTRRHSVEDQESPLATLRQRGHFPSPRRDSMSSNHYRSNSNQSLQNEEGRKRGVSFSHGDESDGGAELNVPSRYHSPARSPHNPLAHGRAHGLEHSAKDQGHHHHNHQQASPVHHTHTARGRSPAHEHAVHSVSPQRSHAPKSAAAPVTPATVTPVNSTWTEIKSPAPQSQLVFGSGGPKDVRTRYEAPETPASDRKRSPVRTPASIVRGNEENVINATSHRTPLPRGKAVTPSRIKPSSGTASMLKARTSAAGTPGGSAADVTSRKPSSRTRVPTAPSVSVNLPAAIPKYQYYDEEPVNPFKFASADGARDSLHYSSSAGAAAGPEPGKSPATRSPSRVTARSPKG